MIFGKEPGLSRAESAVVYRRSKDLAPARKFWAFRCSKDNEMVGAITIYRQQVRPFSDKQIALVANFAGQAVIAIENTRLLNELRQRTTDLTESLEQQTATSEVLSVISSSPGELEPVFNAMLENAVKLCGAKNGNLLASRWRSVPRRGATSRIAELIRRLGASRTGPRPSSGSSSRPHHPNQGGHSYRRRQNGTELYRARS